MTTPFDDPQAGLAWMFVQCMCEGGDIDEGFALLNDDFTYWNLLTRTTIDKSALRRLIERHKQIVEISADLLGCVNEGENVVIEARGYGITADGDSYDNVFAFFFETRDGQIVALREYSDTRLAARVFPPDIAAG